MGSDTKKKGFFLVIEGIDGCGKSTLIQALARYFKAKNIPVHITAEPSQFEIGKLIRQSLQNSHIPAALDALLFAADRVDHCFREISPLLAQGYVVISDRYRDSSFVYQSIQGKQEGLDSAWIRSLNRYSLNPDVTVLLDIDPAISHARRTAQNTVNGTVLEKFENLDFQRQIRAEFLQLVMNSSEDPHIILDANVDPEVLLQGVLRGISPFLAASSLHLPQ